MNNLVGMVVWLKPRGDRTNQQRARIEAYAVNNVMVTMLGSDEVELYPVEYICGLEVDETMTFRVEVPKQFCGKRKD